MSPIVRVDGRLGRAVQKMAQSDRNEWFALGVAPKVDAVLSKLTGGRLTLTQMIVPTLLLTATGAKSGEPRTTPLATLPEPDGSWLVVGSNFGKDKHPAWSANLLKTPAAHVTYRGRSTTVSAHLLDDAEKAEVWPRLVKAWPNYDHYVEKSGRSLRVFRLTPT